MPFVREKFILDSPKKATIFLQQTLQITQREAQKILDKSRVENNGKIFKNKAGFLCGEVVLSHFKAECGEIKPIFETHDFGAFDKPAKLLSHPKGRFLHKSLLDSIRFYFGKNANPINRLDGETSGILLVSKNKQSEIKLKNLFMQKRVGKTYLAVVFGRIDARRLAQKFGENIIVKDSSNFIINFALTAGQKGIDLGIRSKIDKNGKIAQTAIKILHYDKNTSHLMIMPLTGRTHQIRAHLAHIGHRIMGESLYGISDNYARDFLDGKISDSDRTRIFGANRLMLHAQSLYFSYNDNEFFIKSKMDFGFA